MTVKFWSSKRMFCPDDRRVGAEAPLPEAVAQDARCARGPAHPRRAGRLVRCAGCTPTTSKKLADVNACGTRSGSPPAPTRLASPPSHPATLVRFPLSLPMSAKSAGVRLFQSSGPPCPRSTMRDEGLQVRQGHGLPQQRIAHAENSGGGADPQSNGDHGRRREPRRIAQHAGGIANILQQSHGTSPYYTDNPLRSSMRLRRAVPREPLPQRVAQIVQLYGLGHVVVHAGGEAALAAPFHHFGGHGDDRRARSCRRRRRISAVADTRPSRASGSPSGSGRTAAISNIVDRLLAIRTRRRRATPAAPASARDLLVHHVVLGDQHRTRCRESRMAGGIHPPRPAWPRAAARPTLRPGGRHSAFSSCDWRTGFTRQPRFSPPYGASLRSCGPPRSA